MSMGTKDYAAITGSINEGIKGLRETGAVETLTQFTAMSKAAMADGALDKKMKELIALSIGVATHCDGCIGFHTKALKRLGATDEEVSEALGVTVYMGGGPSLMYAADAWNAWQALKE